MPSLESHIESARSLIKDIEEKLRLETAVERQKLVGFACSEVSCDLLAILMHKKNLIDPGFNINHRFFASERTAKEKFPLDFPAKRALMPQMVRQEELRNLLCYGKPKGAGLVEEAVKNLFDIKKIIEKESGEKI